MSIMKRCNTCQVDKTTEQFWKCSSYKDKLRIDCIDCAKYKKQHPVPKIEEVSQKTKTCAQCKIIKSVSYFGLATKSKDGHNWSCKECINKKKTCYKANREERENLEKLNMKKCTECKQDKNFSEFLKDKNCRNGYKTKCRDCTKKQKNKYMALKRHSDPRYKIECNVRRRILNAVTRNKQGKTSKSTNTMELLGCQVPFLMEYLEDKFKEGMSWENYGDWHIDHIKPCALFNLVNKEEQKQCFHYTNLQPLWATENLKKGAKYDKE